MDKELITRLCTDKAFGILTRNGLEYRVETSEINYKAIALLDFCNVSRLNAEFGYEEINRRFTELFKPFKNDLLIGRCFSGDEIVILAMDENDCVTDELVILSSEIGLPFRYCISEFNGDIDASIRLMGKQILSKGMT